MDRYEALRRALAWSIAKRSLAIAAGVGSILNVINQGDELFGSGAVNWWKALLTYCVPFCVATYGAYSVHRSPGPSAPL